MDPIGVTAGPDETIRAQHTLDGEFDLAQDERWRRTPPNTCKSNGTSSEEASGERLSNT